MGSSEAKIARRGMVPSKGLESKASPNKNWTWVAWGTKFDRAVLNRGHPRYPACFKISTCARIGLSKVVHKSVGELFDVLALKTVKILTNFENFEK